jgi:ATP-binding cassette subfamily F protein uup
MGAELSVSTEILIRQPPKLMGRVLGIVYRAFLRRMSGRILELDRGKLTDWPGDYANFLRRKQELLYAEE